MFRGENGYNRLTCRIVFALLTAQTRRQTLISGAQCGLGFVQVILGQQRQTVSVDYQPCTLSFGRFLIKQLP